MELQHGAHLAYCTNVHAAETWNETFAALQRYTLAVRRNVAADRRYGIGLRLSDLASQQLLQPGTLAEFREWLDRNDCYVFTINGFPFGRFHGAPVKERVFQPDWNTTARVDYTNRLFDILGEILPPGIDGSVSTLPGGFKESDSQPGTSEAMIQNVLRCLDHVTAVSARSGHKLHLGFEPEPFGLFENTSDTLAFFDRLLNAASDAKEAVQVAGVTYDTCHFALQYETADASLSALHDRGIKISKVHLSSALKAAGDAAARARLNSFRDDTYLHQVIARTGAELTRYRDLPLALAADHEADEWRVHFHVPLYADAGDGLQNTSDHVQATLDWLAAHPGACSHLEMETYTWEVLPEPLKTGDVVEQLTREYEWTLPQLAARQMA